MSRRTMIIILIVSVGINIGLLGTVIYDVFRGGHRLGGPPPFPKWVDSIEGLSPTQRDRICEIMMDNAGPIDEIRKEIRKKDGELALLISAKETDTTAIGEKVAEIAGLHAKMQQLIVSGIIEVKGVLTPEQQEIFLDHMMRFIPPPPPGERGHRMRGMDMGRGMEWGRGGRPDR